MMNECDTLLIVGSGFPWSDFLPEEGKARAVQIDLEAAMLLAPLSVRGEPPRQRRRRLWSAFSRFSKKRATAAGARRSRRELGLVGNARRSARAKRIGLTRDGWISEMSPLLPQCHCRQRQRLLRELVHKDYRVKRGSSASLSGGLAWMGTTMLCDRCQVRQSDPACDRFRWRRRDADEQYGPARRRREYQ